MQDADPRSLVAAAVVIVVAVVVVLNRRRVLYANLSLFAELLQGEIRFPVLGLPVYATVTGRYKGREVTCRWSLLTKYEEITLYMVVIGRPEGTSWPRKSDGEPTEYTCLDGNRIYYCRPSGLFISAKKWHRPHLPGLLRKRLLQSDVAYYLEHLAEAANLVESGSVQTAVTAQS